MRLLVVTALLLGLFYDSAIANTSNFEKTRFTPFEPSFLLPAQKSKPANGQADDRAMEARFSFQYIVFNCNLSFKGPSEKCNENADTFELSLSYTGEFDFYMGTRESGPVINRISNPALNFGWKLKDKRWKSSAFSFSKLGFSIEHRSNGQVVDVDDTITDESSPDAGMFLTQIEFEQGNQEYFDSLSRGANYVNLKSRFHVGHNSKNAALCNSRFSCVNIWADYKLYFSDDSNITWGRLANSGVNIEDYDLLRIILSNTFNVTRYDHPITLSFDYTIGKKLTETDSFDINVVIPLRLAGWNVPLLFRYHHGPMDRLSDYTREYESIGLGLYLYSD